MLHLFAYNLISFPQGCVRSSFEPSLFVEVAKCWPTTHAWVTNFNFVLPQIYVSETVFDFILRTCEYESPQLCWHELWTPDIVVVGESPDGAVPGRSLCIKRKSKAPR